MYGGNIWMVEYFGGYLCVHMNYSIEFKYCLASYAICLDAAVVPASLSALRYLSTSLLTLKLILYWTSSDTRSYHTSVCGDGAAVAPDVDFAIEMYV